MVMSQTGQYSKKEVLQMNKYNIDFSIETIQTNLTRLVNQCWKLIPMRENNENWDKQLDTLIIEITGLNEIFYQEPQFLQTLSKLEGLKIVEIDFVLYRKTVFEIISLLQGLKTNERLI